VDDNPYQAPQSTSSGLGFGLGCGWLVLLMALVPVLIYGAFVALSSACHPIR
jgi:hypothetical protein